MPAFKITYQATHNGKPYLMPDIIYAHSEKAAIEQFNKNSKGKGYLRVIKTIKEVK